MPSRYSSLLAALVVALLVGFTAQAQTTYTVENLNDSGDGSLRQVLAGASEGATITFQSGLSGTIGLGSPLVIGKGVTIDGPGRDVIAVSGQGATRILSLQTEQAVTLRGITLQNGFIDRGYGAALYADYDTALNANLTLDDVAVVDNEGEFAGALSLFGGQLTIANSTISGNRATRYDRGGYAAVSTSSATLLMTNSVVSSNTSGSSAISVFGPSARIENSAISGNTVENGEAVAQVRLTFQERNSPNPPRKVLTLSGTTFQNNTSAGAPSGCGGIVESEGGNTFDSFQAASSCGAGTNDVFPPPVVTNLDDSGPGSLRSLLSAAPGGSTITFQDGLSGTITLASGQLISEGVSIQGPGADVITIEAGNQSRAFDVRGDRPVTISGLTLEGGNGNVNGGEPLGGGIHSSASLLTVEGMVFEENYAAYGGALFTQSGKQLVVRGSTFRGNEATGSGGAIMTRSGGTADISGSTFENNSASDYGAALMFGGDGARRVQDTRIAGGTGPSVIGSDAGGTIALQGVTFERSVGEECEGEGAFVSEGGNQFSVGTTCPVEPTDFSWGEATARSFEDRVTVEWTGQNLGATYPTLSVYRRAVTDQAPASGEAGDLLAVAASSAGSFVDRTGVPMQQYEYCVEPAASGGSTLPIRCATSRRVIRPVEALTATEGTRADEVRLSWRNTSELASRSLRVYRQLLSDGQTAADAAFSDADILADDLSASATSYTDASAEPGTRYAYAVATVAQGVPSDLERAMGFRSVVPAPVDLAAGDGVDPAGVDLAWALGEDFDASGFAVYRELLSAQGVGDGALDPATSVLATIPAGAATAGSAYTWRDETADASAFYEYCVVTQTASGGASAAVCDAGSRVGLLPPTNLAATDGTFDDRIELTWTDAGPDETGYTVSRRCASVRDGAACPDGLSTTFDERAQLAANATEYADRDVVQGVTYAYQVVAVTAAGAVSAGATDTGSRADVLAPNAIAATDGTLEDRVEMTWTTDATTAMVHNLYRDGALIGVVPPDVLAFDDEGIASDVTHSYCVSTLTVPTGTPAAQVASARAEIARMLQAAPDADPSALGRLSQGAKRVVARVAGPQAVAGSAAGGGPRESDRICDDGFRSLIAPTGVAASDAQQGDDERWVRLAWQDASQVEAGYRAYRWPIAGGDTVLVARTGPSRGQALDTTAVPGTRYLYAVRAYDDRGPATTDARGTWGGRSRITTGDGTLLGGPTDEGRRELLAPTEVRASSGRFEDRVEITWTDNSAVTDGAGYRVYRWPSSQGATQPTTAAVACDLADPRATSCVDAGFTTADYGVDYIYRVAAFDAYGESLPARDGVDTDRGGTVILPPADLRASTGYEGKVVLTWNDVSRVNTAYRISRDGNEVAMVGDLSTYTDLDGTGRYCVRSVAGSKESAEVCASGRRLAANGPSVAQGFGLGLSAPLAPVDAAPGGLFGLNVSADQDAVLAGEYAAGDGRAHIFQRNGSAWEVSQTIPSPGSYTLFGRSVAVSGDMAIVGAPAGQPGVMTATKQLTYTLPSDSRYSYTFDWTLSAALPQGAAHVYERNGSQWDFTGISLTSGGFVPKEAFDTCFPSTFSGSFPNLVFDIDRGACADAPFQNIGYRVDWTGYYSDENETNTQLHQETVSTINLFDNLSFSTDYTYTSFGFPTAVDGPEVTIKTSASKASNTAFAVFAALTNSHYFASSTTRVHVYERSGSSLTYQAEIQGASYIASIAADGRFMVTGDTDPTQNRAHVYRNDSGTWTHIQSLEEEEKDNYGASVSVKGDRIAVGSYGTRSYVYLYDEASGQFQREQMFTKPVASATTDTGFGTSIALDERDDTMYLIIGSDRQSAGYAYVFGGNTWNYLGALQANPGEERDGLGVSATLIGNEPVMGASGNGGALYFGRLGLEPSGVVASDGTYDNRIQVRWADQTDIEEGFRIYRSTETLGSYELIGTVDPDVGVYDDFDASPGSAAEYCVAAYNIGADGEVQESLRACDAGWLPPDGIIGGRVASREGAGVVGIDVCLAPSANRALLLDGIGGWGTTDMLNVLPRQFTVEAWVKRARTDVQELIVGHGEANVTREGLFMGFRQNGGFAAGFWGDDLDVPPGMFTPGYEPTEWNHWAVTVDGPTRQVYLNGALLAQSDAGGGTYAGRGTFYVGAGPEGVYPFSGLVDEARLWTGVRTGEQIAGAMNRTLGGSEAGLLAHWPLDQLESVAAPDITPTAAHLSLTPGAHWAEGAPGFDACRTTDDEGAYTFAGLRYGEGKTFEVEARSQGRQFQPRTQNISLSPESPVQNQTDFTDVSAFAIQGIVQLGTDAGACPADSVSISLDGDPVAVTGADGAFSLAALPTSTTDTDNRSRTVSARRIDGSGDDLFAFDPQQHVLQVTGDRDGVNFAVTTTRTLRGIVSGSCDMSVGTVRVRVYTESGCFDRTYTNDELDAGIQLPPQRYLVDVVDVSDLPPGSLLSAADVLAFYDGLGTQFVDLTAADTTLEMIYRAPVVVSVDGLPAGNQCSAITAGSRTLPGVPVIKENERISLQVSVVERYGPGQECPVEGAEVSIVDGFSGTASVDTTGADGTIRVQSRGLLPELTSGAIVAGVDRSYQRPFEASASVPGRGTTTTTEWAIVEGFHERTGDFVSATTAEMPLLVLHDPPGTDSYAYLEEGTTVCSSFSDMTITNTEGGFTAIADVGFKGSLGFGVLVAASAKAFWETRITANVGGGGGNAIETCMTTTERYATSTDNSSVSEDIFIGYGLNLLFAQADRIKVNSCEAEFSETIAFDFDPDNPLNTTYTYSATHIKTDLIPSLENLLENGPDANPETRDAERDSLLKSSLTNWRRYLDDNAANVAKAMEGETVNRSFSAGTEYEWSEQADTSRTNTRVFDVGLWFDNEFGFSAEAAGSGFKKAWVLNTGFQNELTWEKGEDDFRAVGYVLSDNDTGDYFSVDVGTDPVYNVPAFQMVSGRSSNPWEPGTQKRDVPRISVTPSVLTGVGAGDAGSFQLILSNDSESGETRPYVLAVPGELNPGNLGLTVTGDLLGGDRTETFRIPAGESRVINLDVLRPPSDVYSFEDVGLIFYSDVERSILDANPERIAAMVDTAYISVHFAPPCSPVELLRPEGGWRVNIDSPSTVLPLKARRLSIDSLRAQEVGFEYRRDGGPWTTITKWTSKQLHGQTSASFEWDPSSGNPDASGDYQVRAYTQCQLESGGVARNNTPVAEGRFDLTRPRLAGTPQPGDGALDLGDDVTVRFTEALDCVSVQAAPTGTSSNPYRALGIRDASGEHVLVDAVCDGDRVTITPQDPGFWAGHEGERFTAFVQGPTRSTLENENYRVLQGLTDRAGNPLSDAGGRELSQSERIAWDFTVRRSMLRFDPPNVAVDLGRGQGTTATAELANDDAHERTMKIAGVPSWLSLRVGAGLDTTATDTLATLPADGRLPLTFDVADTLAMGAHRAEVWTYGMDGAAVDSSQAARLRFDVLVGCAPPDWQLDPSTFAYSMQMLADVRVPRSGDPNAVDLNRATNYRALQSGQLAAFVGQELRGVAEVSALGTEMLAALTVYGNRERGEAIRFEVYDPATCVRYPAAGPAAAFESGRQIGSPSAPTTVFATPPSQSGGLAFAAGWTWFSLPWVPADASVDAVLRGLPASDGDRIEGTDASGQQAFAQYAAGAGAWIGSLTSLRPGAGYKLYLSQQGFLPEPATPALPVVTEPVGLIAGWNWIGYLPGCPAPVETVLGGLSAEPQTGDLLKGQRGFAVYDQAAGGWFGSLDRMTPGAGYQLRTTAGGSLTFPGGFQPGAGGSCGGAAPSSPSPAPSLWRAAPEPFAAQMTLVVSVPNLAAPAAGDTTAYEVVALSGDGDEADARVARGVAPLTYDADLGHHVAYLTVGGHGGGDEEVLLRLGRAGEAAALAVTAGGTVEPTAETPDALAFASDEALGTPSRPLAFDGVALEQPTTTGIGRTGIPVAFALDAAAPNPVRERTTLRYALPAAADVRLEVFDMLGRKVAVVTDALVPAGYHDLPFDAGALAAGSYVVRIRAESAGETHRAVRRIVVVR